MGPRNHVLDSGTCRRHLANPIDWSMLSCSAGCHYHYRSNLLLLLQLSKCFC